MTDHCTWRDCWRTSNVDLQKDDGKVWAKLCHEHYLECNEAHRHAPTFPANFFHPAAMQARILAGWKLRPPFGEAPLRRPRTLQAIRDYYDNLKLPDAPRSLWQCVRELFCRHDFVEDDRDYAVCFKCGRWEER